jgi:glycerate 2-kinase
MDLGALLHGAFAAGVRAVAGRAATCEAAAALDLDTPPIVLALGKVAAQMAWGLHDAVGALAGGVVVTNAAAEVPPGLRLIVGSHPVPGSGSLAGGEALLGAAGAIPAGGTVVALVSGGGSAIAEALRPGVALDDLQQTTEILLRSGAPIDDVNLVRTALSRLKGGGLAGAAPAARVITLAISDVVGDDPATIASGPTVARDPREAAEVLRRWGVDDAVPAAVRRAVDDESGVERRSGELYVIVASRRQATEAASAWLEQRCGLEVVTGADLVGEAREVARRLVVGAEPHRIAIHAGETTVTVVGDGRGGRNHEGALAAAIAIGDDPATVFLAAGTDGRDGTAEGTGAFVDASTVAVARELGLDPVEHLDRNDSGGFFDRVPGRIDVGPTGTNVGDLWLVARS